MSDDAEVWLLLSGPAGAAGLYWFLYRFYRNTDKSHAFERETAVVARPVTGSDADQKVDEIKGTQESRIRGDNVNAFRQRAERVRREGG